MPVPTFELLAGITDLGGLSGFSSVEPRLPLTPGSRVPPTLSVFHQLRPTSTSTLHPYPSINPLTLTDQNRQDARLHLSSLTYLCPAPNPSAIPTTALSNCTYTMHLATNRLWQTTPSSLRRYPSDVTHHVPIIQHLDMSKDATGLLVPSTSSIKPIPVGRGPSILGYNNPMARYPPGQSHSSVMSAFVSLNPTVATCGSGSDSDSDSDLELESSPVSPHLTPDPDETPASPIDEQALDEIAHAQCLEVLEWFKKQEVSTHMEKESIDTFEPPVRGSSVADGYETCQSQFSDDDNLDSTSSFSAGLVRCEECGGCKLDSCEERDEDTTSTESAGSGPATPSTHYSVPRIYVPSATHHSDGSHDDHIPAQTSAPAIPRPSPVNTPLPSFAQPSIDSSSAQSVPKVWPASTLDRPSSAYETYIPIYPSSLAIYRKQAIDGLAILSRLANDYGVDCTHPTQVSLQLPSKS